MKSILPIAILAVLQAAGCSGTGMLPAESNKIVRVGVTGGMTKTGTWEKVAQAFEAQSDYKLQLVAEGDASLATELCAGKADLITMHSGDEITDVVARGLGINKRPWTANEQVIIGPESDPAGIKGMKDAAAALRRIAETESPFVDSRHMSARVIGKKLWEKAGIDPIGPWILKDESYGHAEHDVIFFAKEKNAYVIVGRKKMLLKETPPGMQIMVEGDPAMRRTYVVVAADPKAFPTANYAGACALADFMVSHKAQEILAEFGADEHNGIPFFHPLPTGAFSSKVGQGEKK